MDAFMGRKWLGCTSIADCDAASIDTPFTQVTPCDESPVALHTVTFCRPLDVRET
jgi:hypothetical protein